MMMIMIMTMKMKIIVKDGQQWSIKFIQLRQLREQDCMQEVIIQFVLISIRNIFILINISWKKIHIVFLYFSLLLLLLFLILIFIFIKIFVTLYTITIIWQHCAHFFLSSFFFSLLFFSFLNPLTSLSFLNSSSSNYFSSFLSYNFPLPLSSQCNAMQYFLLSSPLSP